ncbi:uncharacterized protein [Patagioenas fasciata]|uniref:uncharacterized protein n=1 Tax=Patagioenas fasciata TaxID=372321 RepID=UPI003A99B973
MTAASSPVQTGPDSGTGQCPAGGAAPPGAPAAAPVPAAGFGARPPPGARLPRRPLSSHLAGSGGLQGGPALPGRVPAPARPPRRGPRLTLTCELVSSDPRWTLTPGSRAAAGRAMHVGQVGVRPSGSSLREVGETYGEGGTKLQPGWRQRGPASTSAGGLPCRRCCGRGKSSAAGVSGPGAALSSGGSGPRRGERRLAAGAGSGCCSWDPAWKSEKDTPSTTAGSQMKTSGLLHRPDIPWAARPPAQPRGTRWPRGGGGAGPGQGNPTPRGSPAPLLRAPAAGRPPPWTNGRTDRRTAAERPPSLPPLGRRCRRRGSPAGSRSALRVPSAQLGPCTEDGGLTRRRPLQSRCKQSRLSALRRVFMTHPVVRREALDYGMEQGNPQETISLPERLAPVKHRAPEPRGEETRRAAPKVVLRERMQEASGTSSRCLCWAFCTVLATPLASSLHPLAGKQAENLRCRLQSQVCAQQQHPIALLHQCETRRILQALVFGGDLRPQGLYICREGPGHLPGCNGSEVQPLCPLQSEQ